VEVCPVDCFHEGENFLVINPDVCIDCGVCVPECPVDAIIIGKQDVDGRWLEINRKYAEIWPIITVRGKVPADAEQFADVTDKFAKYFSEAPGKGS
jgi:ferredoxin